MARSDWEKYVDAGGVPSWTRRDDLYYVGIDEYGWELRENNSWYLQTFKTPEEAMDFADKNYPRACAEG